MRLFARDAVYAPGRRIGDYTVERVSGEGRYGICYLVNDGQQNYILKQLKKGMLKASKARAGFEREILSSLEHRSIPRFIRKIEDESFCGYILEYKEGRTFEDLIHAEDRVFSGSEICEIGRQLVGILKYLHQSGIVHRDIRIPNTLYSSHGVYLVDFGLARRIDGLKYRPDIDFAYLGDFLLHLYYTSYEMSGKKKRPWHEELNLKEDEMLFLKRLVGVEKRYRDIDEVECDFLRIIRNRRGIHEKPSGSYRREPGESRFGRHPVKT